MFFLVFVPFKYGDITKKLFDAEKLFGIQVLDYIMAGERDYWNFKDS